MRALLFALVGALVGFTLGFFGFWAWWSAGVGVWISWDQLDFGIVFLIGAGVIGAVVGAVWFALIAAQRA